MAAVFNFNDKNIDSLLCARKASAPCRLFFSLAMALSLWSCSSGTSPEAQGGCPSVGDLSVVDLGGISGENRCQISGTLTVSAVLPNTAVWLIDGAVQVGDSASSPELFISKGTRIRGSTDGINPDYLYISAGASIDARGEVDSPIIFSSNDDIDLNVAGGGKWGGIIIEDTVAFNAENRLEYVVIAEGGAEVTINSKTYNSNLTLDGDHDNTILRYVQSHDARGDGIRLQGSNGTQNTARMDWLLITGAGRDALSYQDFSGLVKDVLAINRVGQYNPVELSGGRAGVYAAGAASQPLLTNLTLVGNDDESIANPSATQREMGIIFADDTSINGEDLLIRLANSAIVNFRHGCYELESDADLSAVDLTGPTTSFIDGVHCVNESGTAAVKSVIRSSNTADDLTITGSGNGEGLRFHSLDAVFHRETVGAAEFTAGWHLKSIGAFVNGITLSLSALNAFNDGDTDDDGTVNTNDVNALPLLNNSAAFYSSVDGASSAIENRGYDLTHIGAVRTYDKTLGDSSAQFDGWTLQDGATTTAVVGFQPFNP